MIQNPFANMTPVVKNLLIINIIFYAAAYILGHAGIFDMDHWFAAYYPDSPHFRLWQIVSYMFMHAPLSQEWGFFHIMFNMIALVSFGPIIEQTIGNKRFLSFYFICGIGALACQMAVQAIELHAAVGAFSIRHLGEMSVTAEQVAKVQSIYSAGLVGASGAIFGVLIAFGMLYPDLELMIIPIPVPVKAKYIIPGYIVIELFLGVRQYSGDSVAHFAHLGGALVGFIVIKLWGYRSRNNFY
jgi:membrane associated rhomboid family serine protease